MIYRIALVAFLGALSYLTVSAVVTEKKAKIQSFNPNPPYSGGPGLSGAGDRTGSPISSGTCASCHGGGVYSPAISIQVLDGVTPVTSYIPGNVYTVRFTVTGGAPRYGFQGVALRPNNSAAGTLNTPGANTQVVSIGGIPYVEHTSPVATSGIFTSQWTAPASGAGSIKFYGVGLASNSNGSTNGDNASASVNITLTEVIPTTISYPSNPFCANDANQTPVQTGTLGGNFSGPPGLSLNGVTGVINVAASMQGTHLVTYTYGTGLTTTFNVTINPTTSSSFALTICDNETYAFGSQTLDGSDAGIHTEVFQAANGCDSTVQLNLSVTPSVTISQSATICETQTFVFNGQTLDANNAGLNTAVLTAANGCDSIIELTLNVLPSLTTNLTATICETDTYDFNGQTLDATNVGLNTANLQTVDGCDSTVNLTLNVEVINSSITNNAGVLSSNQAGATYMWVDCDSGNLPINGATNSSFAPVVTGNYAVIITVNGCVETSSCENVIVGGMEELEANNSLVYPNPVIDLFEITQKEGFGEILSITLLDSKGKVVQVISPLDQFTDISRLEAGVYFLKIVHASGESMLSLVKK